jgi:hypothetical protein
MKCDLMRPHTVCTSHFLQQLCVECDLMKPHTSDGSCFSGNATSGLANSNAAAQPGWHISQYTDNVTNGLPLRPVPTH